MLGKIAGGRRRGQQRVRLLFGITDSMDTSLSKLRELVIRQGGLPFCIPMGRKELDMTELLMKKAMAPQSSTLAWKIPGMEEPGGLQFMGSLRVGHDWALHFHFSPSCIGEGNGNPLQYSCLENPRDGGAQWAAVYGVTQSRTRLKRLSSSSSRK